MRWYVVDVNDSYPDEREVWIEPSAAAASVHARRCYAHWARQMRIRAERASIDRQLLADEAAALDALAAQLDGGLSFPRVSFAAVPGTPHDLHAYTVDRLSEAYDIHHLPRERVHLRLPISAAKPSLVDSLWRPRARPFGV